MRTNEKQDANKKTKFVQDLMTDLG